MERALLVLVFATFDLEAVLVFLEVDLLFPRPLRVDFDCDGIAFCLTHPVKANCNNGSFLYYLRVHGTRMLRML